MQFGGNSWPAARRNRRFDASARPRCARGTLPPIWRPLHFVGLTLFPASLQTHRVSEPGGGNVRAPRQAGRLRGSCEAAIPNCSSPCLSKTIMLNKRVSVEWLSGIEMFEFHTLEKCLQFVPFFWTVAGLLGGAALGLARFRFQKVGIVPPGFAVYTFVLVAIPTATLGLVASVLMPDLLQPIACRVAG